VALVHCARGGGTCLSQPLIVSSLANMATRNCQNVLEAAIFMSLIFQQPNKTISVSHTHQWRNYRGQRKTVAPKRSKQLGVNCLTEIYYDQRPRK